MKFFLHLRWLAGLLLCLASRPAAHASHILGGDIAYAPVAATTAGVPRYHLTVRLFRDVLGVDQPSIRLVCNRSGCNATPAEFFVLDVPRSQAQQRALLGCVGASPFHQYDTYLYDAYADLPRGQWTFIFSGDNRPASLVNIANSATVAFFISAFLDNSVVDSNASPQFLSTLLPYLSSSGAQRYSFSAFDSEGDSLAYHLASPQTSLSTISPPPGALCGSPISTFVPTPFQLDAATGALTAPGTPLHQGYYVLAAQVSEYRRLNGAWQPIGYVVRDVVYLAYSTPNVPPRFTGFVLASGGPAQTFDQLVPVQAGQTVSLLLSATDPDAGQTLRFSSDATSVVPGLSLSSVGATQVRLAWQVPASLPPGRYTATVAVLDDGCPLNASEEQTISFRVGRQVLASLPATPELAGGAFPMPFREQVQFWAAAGGQAVVVVDALGRVVAQLSSQPDGRVQWQPAAS